MGSGNRRKKSIVALGLYIPGTGFTRVLDTLFARLGNSFEIHWIGIAYKGPVTDTGHYVLYPNNLKGGDIFGAYGSRDLALALHADFVFFLNDAYMLKNYHDTHAGQHWKNIAYVPLDGTITDPMSLKGIAFLEIVVAYQHQAMAQFTQGLSRLLDADVIPHIPSVHAIYHGVDTETFSVAEYQEGHMQWRTPYKQRLFGHLERWDESTFLLNANRFNERKDLRTTIDGFAQALALTDKTLYLCLHLPAIESFQRKELDTWINTHGIGQYVLINPIVRNAYADEHQLSSLYKACAIGINTSLGEGWGLVSFEHASCGAAQIVPRHAGLEEIWGEHAEYIELGEEVMLPTNPFMMQRSSAASLGQRIATLCNDPEYLLERSRDAYLHAHRDEFNWDRIAEKWKSIFES